MSVITGKTTRTIIFIVVFVILFWPFREAFVNVPYIPSRAFLVDVAVFAAVLFLALIRVGFKRNLWKQSWLNDPSPKLYKTVTFSAAFAILAFLFGCWALCVSAWQPYYFGDPSMVVRARLVKISHVRDSRMLGSGEEITLLDSSTGKTYSVSWPSETLERGLIGKTVCLRGKQSFVGIVLGSMSECMSE